MVTDDPEVAARWAGSGQAGVFVAAGVAAVPPSLVGSGVALLVGRLSDPTVAAAAHAMDAELFDRLS